MPTRKSTEKAIKALWFNPQNDLALAAGKANYTPPKAARQLARAGELLPFWLADDSDMIITGGVNERWLDDFCSEFGVKVNLWNKKTDGVTPCPWGWSLDARNTFIKLGFGAGTCPDLVQLQHYRELSGRATAEKIDKLMFPQSFSPRTVRSLSDLDRITDTYADVVVKSPWSCSGRGVAFFDRRHSEEMSARVESIIANFGYATVEPRLIAPLEFSLLFMYQCGTAHFHGLSRTVSATAGKYAGNIVAANDSHRMAVDAAAGRQGFVDSLIPAAAEAIAEVLGDEYSGPIGIDMLLSDGRVYLAEHNLRYTMGFVACGIYRKTGLTGTLAVVRADDTKQPGEVSLTQPGHDMRFVLLTS